mgnify:CR=1 FL=1
MSEPERTAFLARFVPEGSIEVADDEEIELASDSPDEIEFDGESFDVGEAVAQSLGLAINPYAEGPRADAVRPARPDAPGCGDPVPR